MISLEFCSFLGQWLDRLASQLAERWLPTPEVRDSNLVIGVIYLFYCQLH